ncbi:MAG: V-type ATP synthase subunit D [Spirochaetes bacterium]|nr:V-type ATP synthase subunit D [Spirochaetota bacterium]MBN2769283.1 V-type ATP synthase subunit D [Spirochaetota bacterium]
MAEIKLNKTELKSQQMLMDQLSKYLPTLQLKKQQLQVEVNSVKNFFDELNQKMDKMKNDFLSWSILLSQREPVDIKEFLTVEEVISLQENIAGVEVPFFDKIIFTDREYSSFSTPLWFDKAIESLKELITVREQMRITEIRQQLLEEELRQTNIKVNLFEKRLIPRCKNNIKKIKIFLGDQEIASICNAKIAKDKLKRKELTAEAV